MRRTINVTLSKPSTHLIKGIQIQTSRQADILCLLSSYQTTTSKQRLTIFFLLSFSHICFYEEFSDISVQIFSKNRNVFFACKIKSRIWPLVLTEYLNIESIQDTVSSLIYNLYRSVYSVSPLPSNEVKVHNFPPLRD